MLKVLMR